VIPAAPLEDDALGGVELLDDETGDDGVGVAARHHEVHAHRLRVISEKQAVMIRQPLEVVDVGHVAVAGREAVDLRIGAVERKGLEVDHVRQQSVLHLEVEVRLSLVPVKNRQPFVVDDGQAAFALAKSIERREEDIAGIGVVGREEVDFRIVGGQAGDRRQRHHAVARARTRGDFRRQRSETLVVPVAVAEEGVVLLAHRRGAEFEFEIGQRGLIGGSQSGHELHRDLLAECEGDIRRENERLRIVGQDQTAVMFATLRALDGDECAVHRTGIDGASVAQDDVVAGRDHRGAGHGRDVLEGCGSNCCRPESEPGEGDCEIAPGKENRDRGGRASELHGIASVMRVGGGGASRAPSEAPGARLTAQRFRGKKRSKPAESARLSIAER
jgi:hypothetical protein